MSEAPPSPAAPSDAAGRLANRLGIPIHCSALRFRVQALMQRFPSPGATAVEDWLLDVANARGADFVLRHPPASAAFAPPPREELGNEDLVAAILQPQNLDRPQMLRAAAQLVSRREVDPALLVATARRERADRVLAELARAATRVEPAHAAWAPVAQALAACPPLREPILHWSRLALPIPDARGCNAQAWRLVA